MFGSHLSVAGAMVNALLEAERLKFDTVQVFTKNQQQWKVKPLEPSVIADWTAALKRLGWQDRTVSHASYLINLASPDDVLWEKSIDLMRIEIERCEQLSIPYLVHHPGAFTSSTPEAGIARIARAYQRLFKETAGFKTITCFEGTTGSGSNLGRTFEELAAIRAAVIEATGRPERVGYCLDTCHMHAGGYDLSTRQAADATLDAFNHICGLSNLKAIHINDSKGAAGSRLDRHAHVGAGTIGRGTTAACLKASGFAAVVTRPELRNIPKILETPKESTEAGTPMDSINLQRLRRLMV